LGWVDSNPCKGIRRNAIKKINRHITDDELRRLIANANHLSELIEFAYVTGLRESDILNLKSISFTDSGLEITSQKTGTKQVFNVSGLILKIKNRLADEPGNVFLTSKGTPWTEHGFNASWRRVKLRANVNCRFHDIRAKILSDARRDRGIDAAQEIAGHGSVTTTEGYTKGRIAKNVEPLEVKI
jgi:integrase